MDADCGQFATMHGILRMSPSMMECNEIHEIQKVEKSNIVERNVGYSA